MLRTLLAAAATVAILGAVEWLTCTRLERLIMVTKDEILASLADVKTLLVETGKDVGRVADKLDAALAAGDLTAVAAAVAELKDIATGIDARAEASDPEPVATPEPVNPDFA